MQIVIHKGFLESLEALSKADRRRTLAFLDKLQEDATSSGLRQHQVMNGFTSLSPTMSVRVIGQLLGPKLIMLHVDQHDAAYKWAERHTLLVDSASNTFELITVGGNIAGLEAPANKPVYGQAVLRILVQYSGPICQDKFSPCLRWSAYRSFSL